MAAYSSSASSSFFPTPFAASAFANFLKAAQRGDLGRAKEIMRCVEEREVAQEPCEEGSSDRATSAAMLLKGKDEDGYTALHRAAYNGRLPMMQWLIER